MKKENELHLKYNKISYLLISFHTGIATLADIALQYYLKDDLKLQPGSFSKIVAVVYIPWMVKPVFGLISDTYPLLGYRRKTYLLLCGLLDMLAWFGMAFLVTNVYTATFALFLVNIALSFSSVIGEAIVVELSKSSSYDVAASNNAKDNISAFFIIKNIGVLASSYLKGYLVDVISIRSIFVVAGLTPILLVISSYMMFEERIVRNTENTTGDNAILIKPEPKRMFHKELLSFILQKQILWPLAFITLLMSTPAYDDPLFYFLTEELKFSGNILGLMSFASAITAILAIFIYKQFFKQVSFKKVLVVGNSLYGLFGFSALMLVTRFNKTLGISDYLIAIFSSSACNMIAEFIIMPILSLAAILCPKDLEATVYSVFMSSINFGYTISYIMSSILTEVMGITTTNFDNLPKLIFISNVTCLLPLILLFFIDDKYFHPEKEARERSLDRELHQTETINNNETNNGTNYYNINLQS
jgi:folate/biopterin transporter